MTLFSETSTLKERAAKALQDSFLREAVALGTERLKNQKIRSTEEFGNWEEWRRRGQEIRSHTIAHLDYYLEQFIDQATRLGSHVHFAKTDKEAVEHVLRIVKENGAKRVVKTKSMVSEEIRLNHYLEKEGVEAIETDLGEYILQLAGEHPSHLIGPAMHKNIQQIAEALSKVSDKPLPPIPEELAAFARKVLREKFLSAEVGITGCNFAIAETGSITLFTNEGNARMVTTYPKTHIVLMGMERIVPTWEDLEVMANLLPRSGTGQKLTVGLTVISGPKRQTDVDGPEQLHIIILDNGRSRQLGDPDFQEVLNCIRCGACLNVCPVYRHVGGHAYGSVYSGPIGAVLTPLLNDSKRAAELSYASSLCGACFEACPVRIPLHDMLVKLRIRGVEAGNTSTWEKWSFGIYGKMCSNPALYQTGTQLARWLQAPFVRDGYIQAELPVLKNWTKYRKLPRLEKSFRKRWIAKQTQGRKDEE